MKQFKTLRLLGAILIVISAVGSTAYGLEAGVSAGVWYPKLSGDISLDGVSNGTTLDLSDDLGMDDEYIPTGSVFIGAGNHRLTVGLSRIDYSGSETLTRDVTFGDETFTVGTKVDGSLEYDLYDFSYQYTLIDLENVAAGFSISPLINVLYFDGEIAVSGDGMSESEDIKGILPMAGVGVHLGILADFLEVHVEAAGVRYRDNLGYNLKGEISFNPVPFFEITGGYRAFTIEIEEGDANVDYSQQGPYLGVTLKI